MTSRRRHLVVDTSVVVTIVALGIVAAGLLPHSAVEDGSDATDLVSEPVEYPVDIPGCYAVDPPPDSDASVVAFAIIGGGSGYDDPVAPWLTAGKATVMSDAVRTALPTDVEIQLASPSSSFIFQPIEDYGEDAPPGFVPDTSATGTLVRGDESAFTSVSVSRSDTGVPPCVAGALDERAARGDGTVVDTQETWYELDGVRSYSRSAVAYHPDGTRVGVQVSGGETPVWLLETSRIADIAALPELRTTVPAPPGTPAPQKDCSVFAAGGSASDVRPESIDRANAVLTASWETIPDRPVLSRPIGSLVPDGFGSAACTVVDVVGSPVGLSVTVASDQPMPVELDPYDPESAFAPPTDIERLADGTVIERVDADGGSMSTESGDVVFSRSVTVTRPSGVQVRAQSTVTVSPTLTPTVPPREPLSLAVLDVMAQSPIGSWP